MRELLIAHLSPIPPATSIRSTVLQSSLASLRLRGHFDDWNSKIEPRFRATIVESLAPSWMPIEVAIAHYSACEALALPISEQIAMGEAVGNRIQGSFMATLMKSARAAGFDPLVLLGQFDRLFARLFQGGSVQVVQTGPKDLDIEIRGVPLTRQAYFRVAFTGVVRAGFVFAGVKAAYVKQESYSAPLESFSMHASWV